MKIPKLKINSGGSGAAPGAAASKLQRLITLALIVSGVVLLVAAALFFTGGGDRQADEAALGRAQQSMRQVGDVVQNFRRVLEDEQVQELAILAAADPAKLANLKQYVSGRLPGLVGLTLFEPGLGKLRAAGLEPFGYAVLDMLLTAEESGVAPAQIHGVGEAAYMAMAVQVGEPSSPQAYLLVKVSPRELIAAFKGSLPSPGAFEFDQVNGRFKPSRISPLAAGQAQSGQVARLNVPSSLFRIGFAQNTATAAALGLTPLVLGIVGVALLLLGVLKARPRRAAKEPPPLEPVRAAQLEPPAETSPEDGDSPARAPAPGRRPGPVVIDSNDGLGAIALPDLGFSLEKVSMPRQKIVAPVELQESIFRAYDIRGIVGETLDADIARQVGQVVGTLALEEAAGPVVVARDGRASGPQLAEGMIGGIASTGCNVIDIGAVPTGVLYFAAFELGKGSGVMVTGSHNPPDYNGFKMLIGGVTQFGQQITDMYKRIQGGNLRVGKGKVSREDVLGRYRDRIASDIQLQRPLRVVADCGNGIGGVCAADVLRGIGADVIPLFDEVDGAFPNHHPDPSDPKNLMDLIESVRVMDADLGVAFDGDADRLGVVTSVGEIIYSDRLMMLFVKDILRRLPGSTIIYDVKCTGHLHRVIEEHGGVPMMYKTGHSLIKNKMKEVDAPFAGEMSGHFFFKERWYGFDCGIYAAARLLEILAADERDPNEVLGELPNSVSTPELKVQMEEGENHAFVAEMQAKARFADAKVTTIDGVRADFADGWGLVRASNTTPVLVVRFDADSEASLQRIKDIFRQQMLAIDAELKLPF